jgi:tetraacyldisaccharide 4'-kinase
VSAPRILLVSNGFGEMSILECIARAIAAKEPEARLAHMPLVGHLPPGAWPRPVGPQADMPSGGLVTYWNVGNIVRDVRAGLIGLTLRQLAFLSHQRRAYDAVVAVGDVFCAAACLLFVRRPTIFVATAKSEYVAPHSVLESAIARRARVTFARDAATAAALSRAGVRAEYVGNVMMDGVADVDVDLRADTQAIRAAVLPGSRSDAPSNAAAAVRRLLRVAALAGKSVQAFVALAPAVATTSITDAIAREGVAVTPTGCERGVVATGRQSSMELLLIRGGLSAALRAAEIVLGQAGTGNEQAAGLGKPVLAAAEPGESPQSVGWYRMRQQKLLGDALLVVPADDEAFARAAVQLLADPARMAAMGAAGRSRMGGPGASLAIADAALAVAREGGR